jgi:hypothetical protein
LSADNFSGAHARIADSSIAANTELDIMNRLSQSANMDASSPNLSIFISASSLWMPNLITPDTEWLEHAPFGFWLVEMLRPRMIVELGCYSGFSYSVFCQAVERLELDARCYAVDTWVRNARIGVHGDNLFKTINSYNETHYHAFSTLIRSDFDAALALFPAGTIDLLHVDGECTYPAAKAIYENWRSRLSTRSVLLFHDTNTLEPDCGAARLWRELRNEFKSFEFLHSNGLGVLGVGSDLPSPLEALFQSKEDSHLVHNIRLFYSRLGQSIVEQVSSRRPDFDVQLTRQLKRQNYFVAIASQRKAELERQLNAAESQRVELERQLTVAKVELHSVLQSNSWRITWPLRRLSRLLRARS